MEFFVSIVNSFVKNSIFDVAGVFGYDESYHPPLVTVQMCCPWLQEAFNLKVIPIVPNQKEGSGHW